MKTELIKQNKWFVIFAVILTACYSFASVAGMAYWQSSGVERNSTYQNHIGGAHHGIFGGHFYHK